MALDDLREYAVAERADLLALLQQLTPEQWNAGSLCPQWRVREVVAHVYSYDELSRADLARSFVRAKLNPTKVNAACLAPYANHTPEQLLTLARRCVHPRDFQPGSKAASPWSTG